MTLSDWLDWIISLFHWFERWGNHLMILFLIDGQLLTWLECGRLPPFFRRTKRWKVDDSADWAFHFTKTYITAYFPLSSTVIKPRTDWVCGNHNELWMTWRARRRWGKICIIVMYSYALVLVLYFLNFLISTRTVPNGKNIMYRSREEERRNYFQYWSSNNFSSLKKKTINGYGIEG